MKAWFALAVAVAAGCLAVCGCSSSSSSSYVKVIQASPGTANVDLEVAGSFAAQNLAYGTTTAAYAHLKAGAAEKVQLFATGQDSSALASQTETLAENQYYTVLAFNTSPRLEMLVEQDNLTAPASGTCKVRLIQGAPGEGSVDVYLTAPGVNITDPKHPVTPWLKGVPFGTVESYIAVPAGSYEIRVTVSGNASSVASDTGAAGVSLAAGSIYTAVTLDPDPNGGSSAYQLLLTQDQPVVGI